MVLFVVCRAAAEDRRNESGLGQRQQVAVGRHDFHFFLDGTEAQKALVRRFAQDWTMASPI